MQLCEGHLLRGFRLVGERLIVLSDNELFGRRDIRRISTKRAKVESRAIDSFLEHGWWDAGEQADDFTPTVHPAIDGGSGLRIDRIMVSDRTPAKLVPGSYTVHVPEDGIGVSDHRMVSCWLEIEPRAGKQ